MYMERASKSLHPLWQSSQTSLRALSNWQCQLINNHYNKGCVTRKKTDCCRILTLVIAWYFHVVLWETTFFRTYIWLFYQSKFDPELLQTYEWIPPLPTNYPPIPYQLIQCPPPLPVAFQISGNFFFIAFALHQSFALSNPNTFLKENVSKVMTPANKG